MLSGSALEYFRFDLPEGKRSLFLMVEILYADEPDVMLDFYATRNFLWTKRTPYDIEHVSAFHLPAVQKDADTSIHLPFEVTHVLVRSCCIFVCKHVNLKVLGLYDRVNKYIQCPGIPILGNLLRCHFPRSQ